VFVCIHPGCTFRHRGAKPGWEQWSDVVKHYPKWHDCRPLGRPLDTKATNYSAADKTRFARMPKGDGSLRDAEQFETERSPGAQVLAPRLLLHRHPCLAEGPAISHVILQHKSRSFQPYRDAARRPPSAASSPLLPV